MLRRAPFRHVSERMPDKLFVRSDQILRIPITHASALLEADLSGSLEGRAPAIALRGGFVGQVSSLRGLPSFVPGCHAVAISGQDARWPHNQDDCATSPLRERTS